MSESAFSRFFQRSTGNTFTNHLVELRLWQACKLLAETTDPITDICFEVGFRNISNFNRLFLRRHASRLRHTAACRASGGLCRRQWWVGKVQNASKGDASVGWRLA